MEPTPPPTQGPRHRQHPPNDLPARIRDFLERARMRLGTSQTMAGVAAVAALVLTIAVVSAVIAASGGDDPATAAQTEPAETSAAAPPSPSVSPSPSPSPSASESAEDDEDPPADTAEESESVTREPEPEYPADGSYRVRQAASGLCLSTGPEPGYEERTVVVLASCDSTYPATLQVAAWDEGVYVINMHFPDWDACMGADSPADEEGYLMAAYSCEFTETQFWELVPLGGGEYAIKTSASGLCVGILEDRSATSGEPTATDSCDSGDATQRFTLE